MALIGGDRIAEYLMGSPSRTLDGVPLSEWLQKVISRMGILIETDTEKAVNITEGKSSAEREEAVSNLTDIFLNEEFRKGG